MKQSLQSSLPLTLRGRGTHRFVSKLRHHWFSLWLISCSTPNHYVSWRRLTVKLETCCPEMWKKKQHSSFKNINDFDNFSKVVAILSRCQCVKMILVICGCLITFGIYVNMNGMLMFPCFLTHPLTHNHSKLLDLFFQIYLVHIACTEDNDSILQKRV